MYKAPATYFWLKCSILTHIGLSSKVFFAFLQLTKSIILGDGCNPTFCSVSSSFPEDGIAWNSDDGIKVY